jgi:nitrous oxidase accessory protein NosD
VVDGQGFSMALPWNVNNDPLYIPLTGEALIQIEGNKNVTIMNVTLSNYFNGISVRNSTNILLLQNSLSQGHSGIYMFSCTNCYIIANQLSNHMIRGFYCGNSSLLNIAYNTMSRDGDEQGTILEHTTYANITRNDFTDNRKCGLTFLGAGVGHYFGNSVGNNIFENNFMDNKVGIYFQADNDLSLDNNVYSNYWNNSEVDLKSVNVYGIDFPSVKIDQTPKQTTISTDFNPAHYPLPFPIPVNEPTNTQNMTSLTILYIVASIFIFSILIFIYVAKKHKQRNKAQD